MEEWNNRTIRIIIALIFLIVLFIIRLFDPIEDVECSKAKDSCTIHSRSVILRNPKFVEEFKISEVEKYRIETRYHREGRHRYNSYRIIIYLTSGRKVYIPNETRSYERAKGIFNNMMNSEHFILKGEFWKSDQNDY